MTESWREGKGFMPFSRRSRLLKFVVTQPSVKATIYNWCKKLHKILCSHSTPLPLRAECDTRPNFKWSTLVWIQCFPSPTLVALPRLMNLVCSNFYPYFARSEMQTAASRIWTCVVVSETITIARNTLHRMLMIITRMILYLQWISGNQTKFTMASFVASNLIDCSTSVARNLTYMSKLSNYVIIYHRWCFVKSRVIAKLWPVSWLNLLFISHWHKWSLYKLGIRMQANRSPPVFFRPLFGDGRLKSLVTIVTGQWRSILSGYQGIGKFAEQAN